MSIHLVVCYHKRATPTSNRHTNPQHHPQPNIMPVPASSQQCPSHVHVAMQAQRVAIQMIC